MKPLIVDAHEDLAYNMITFGRDYSLPMEEIRRREIGIPTIKVNDETTLSWYEYQRGHVALIFSTLFAAPERVKVGDWDTQVYANPDQAHKLYSLQIELYNKLFDQHPDKFVPIRNQENLQSTLEKWEKDPKPPTGLITLMEGAEGVRSIDELPDWWQRGVRIIGPAWMSTRFCGGTREPGPLTREGKDLLKAMPSIGFTLDLSHMAWESALEALDMYEGAIIASHSNALKQVKNGSINRFLTDEIIAGIISHDGVIGIVPFNSFLIEGWKLPDPRSSVPLDMIVGQIDYICQKAGNASHVGFGTDFDGGFGLQRIPEGLDSIADLQKLAPMLEERGYSQSEIALIFGGNWINFLHRTLPS